ALLDGLLDDAGGRNDTEVTPCFACVGGREAGDVRLDERLDALRRKTADEDEGEVARVRESRLVERQRRRKIPPVHRRGRLGLPPEAVPAECGVDGLLEHEVRTR